MVDNIFLTIAHNIYLSREERYKLNEPNAEVSVVGITIPVWVRNTFTSEPAEEVISNYVIKNCSGSSDTNVVDMMPSGFIISIFNKDTVRGILDRKDGGVNCIYMTYQTKINRDGQEVLVINYINIQDISALGEVPVKGNP